MGPTRSSERRDKGARTAGASGLAFVLLLLIGAGMASVPGGHDATAAVRTYYEQHAGVVAVAQLVELVATAPLLVFVVGLARSTSVEASRPVVVAGGGMSAAAVLTVVPPLWLCVVAPTATSSLVHNLARLSDLVDVLLFLTIAWFATTCWRLWRGPGWLRWTSLAVAGLCALRSLEIAFGGSLLEVVAPVAFLVLVVALSVHLLRRSLPSKDRLHGSTLAA